MRGDVLCISILAGRLGQDELELVAEVVHNGMQMDMARAIRYEAELFGMCFAVQDKQEKRCNG